MISLVLKYTTGETVFRQKNFKKGKIVLVSITLPHVSHLFILGVDFNPIASIIVYGDRYPKSTKIHQYIRKSNPKFNKIKSNVYLF
jgi:hypothetical protein